jgi:hypothetical protein
MTISIQERIEAVIWKDAKTYPDAPHAYILRCWNPEVFAWFHEKIKSGGVREEFTLRGKTYPCHYYYHADGYRYWAMRPDGGPNDVLNRCPANQSRNQD